MGNKKRCTRCGQSKGAVEFYLSKRSKDGLHSWCKVCNIKAAKKSYQKMRKRVAKAEARRTPQVLNGQVKVFDSKNMRPVKHTAFEANGITIILV